MTLKNQKQRASRKHLDRLYAEQASLCWWCRRPTAIIRHIPPEAIVKQTADDIYWRIADEFVFEARIATLDHVVPVRDGADPYDAENMVMACAPCNRDRTETKSPRGMARKVCPDCLGPKRDHQRTCQKCRVARAKRFLASEGWLEVPGHADSNQCKFRDPEDGTDHILRHACRIAGGRKGVVIA